ncbi:MAG: hypothetical protein LBU79_08375 [Planctomycetota bacterium]|jgi:hypothetical protein|nr:hypothetical protein [Planctomycetota bacterium]
MSTDDKTLQELYAIRERVSEEIDGMTPEEQAEYFKKGAEKTMAELGIPLKRPEPETAAR